MKKASRRVEAWWYTPASDKDLPPEQQSRFLLRPLTQAQRMASFDGMSWVRPDGTIESRSFQQARELVLSNLLETANFPADDPKPYPGPDAPRADREAYLELMDDIELFFLGNEIRERSSLDTLAKN